MFYKKKKKEREDIGSVTRTLQYGLEQGHRESEQ